MPNATLLGPRLLGGPMAADACNSMKLFVAQRHASIDAYVRAILAWSPDIVWVNAMNEGLLAGRNLLEAGVRHLHVSVHDDPAGLAQKSARYRFLAPFIDRCNRDLLRRAHTVDVVSDSMRLYYDRMAVASGVVYRYIDARELPAAEPDAESTVTIGHVGSAYSEPEVFVFLNALRSISQADGIRFRVLNFGSSPAFTAAAKQFPEIVVNEGDVPEAEVIERLQKCRFVYSMYSFNSRHRVFRETSQPTKMSTYLMAAKPILAHCPRGSSTVDMLSKFKLGLCVTSLEEEAILSGIRGIMDFRLDRDEVRRATEYYCGSRNLDYLCTCFGLKPPEVALTRMARP